MTWLPLRKCDEIVPRNDQAADFYSKMSDKERELLLSATWYKNDIYTVNKRVIGPDGSGGEIVHISIRRNDNGIARDWRDFQKIKNQLCGREAEGLELYPAESRVMDTANQYHLWVFTKKKLPIGWTVGLKMTPEEAAVSGATQRTGA